MDIDILNVRLQKWLLNESYAELRISVVVNSRYLGKKVYEFTQHIANNDFEDLFSRLMRYAEASIREAIQEEHNAKLKAIKHGSKKRKSKGKNRRV